MQGKEIQQNCISAIRRNMEHRKQFRKVYRNSLKVVSDQNIIGQDCCFYEESFYDFVVAAHAEFKATQYFPALNTEDGISIVVTLLSVQGVLKRIIQFQKTHIFKVMDIEANFKIHG